MTGKFSLQRKNLPLVSGKELLQSGTFPLERGNEPLVTGGTLLFSGTMPLSCGKPLLPSDGSALAQSSGSHRSGTLLWMRHIPQS